LYAYLSTYNEPAIEFEKKAFKYYKLAADNGNAKAQERLILYYIGGFGTEINYDEARKYCHLIEEPTKAKEMIKKLDYKIEKNNV